MQKEIENKGTDDATEEPESRLHRSVAITLRYHKGSLKANIARGSGLQRMRTAIPTAALNLPNYGIKASSPSLGVDNLGQDPKRGKQPARGSWKMDLQVRACEVQRQGFAAKRQSDEGVASDSYELAGCEARCLPTQQKLASFFGRTRGLLRLRASVLKAVQGQRHREYGQQQQQIR